MTPKGASAALTLLFTLVASAPALAADEVPRDAVAVVFKESVGTRFVGMLNTVMGTATLKKTNETHYTFRIGSRGNQNDYAVFFAHLPYVQGVTPLPRLSAAERDLPIGMIRVAPGQRGPLPVSPRGYASGQLIVKYKNGATAEQIAQFNRSQGVSLKERIDGTDLSLLALPKTLSVDEARKRYLDSGLVASAEPNRTVTAPPGQVDTQVPPDNGGDGIYLSPDRLLGTHLLVRTRSGGPTMDLVNQIYGTRTIEQNEADQYRVALPPDLNPLVAQRIFRLCPYVMQAEPANGR